MLSLILLCFQLLSTTAWPWNPKVSTTNGMVEGYESDDVLIFHSIPFAQPPVGRLRFRPPIYPAAPWSGVKNVKNQPSICPQLKVTSLFHMGKEDCLNLHVYVPKIHPKIHSKDPLPVLFYIFGGGYALGDGYQDGLYKGSNLAKATNSIVVAVNYRVGPFGFLSHDVLQREDQNGSTGNMGVRDQQAGLKWVRDNIAAFNGDPQRVTIFGESAGGFSVCWHLVSRGSRGLFHQAILESGSCDAQQFFRTAEKQNQFGDEYAASIGCNATTLNNDTAFLNCLRNLETKDIMNGVLSWFNPNWPLKHNSFANDPMLNVLGTGLPGLAPVMPWGPVIDGSETGLKDMPLTILQNGQGNYVPTIWGSNKDEGSIFVPLVSLIVHGGSFPLDANSITLTLLHFFDQNQTMVNEVLALYPLGDYTNSQDSRAAAILRDCFFSCSMRRGARAMNANNVKAWLYHFEFPMKFNPFYNLLGNFHASELGLVFNTWVLPTTSSKDMSATFQRYWGNLANHGDVNIDDVNIDDGDEMKKKYNEGYEGVASKIFWPWHNETGDWNIVMDVPANQQQGLYREKCDYWDQHHFVH